MTGTILAESIGIALDIIGWYLYETRDGRGTPQELADAITALESIPTCGPCGALLLEDKCSECKMEVT